MKGLAAWIAKGVLSAAYWLFALYLATGRVAWIPIRLGLFLVVLAVAALISLGFWPSRPRK